MPPNFESFFDLTTDIPDQTHGTTKYCHIYSRASQNHIKIEGRNVDATGTREDRYCKYIIISCSILYQYIASWEPEGRYYCSTMFHWEPEGRLISLFNDPLRTGRALSLFINDVLLRTGRALSLYNVYDDSALLVRRGTSLISDSALLALNCRRYI